MKTPAERAMTRARSMARTDVAALLLTVAHVIGRLRQLAQVEREDANHWTASRVEALAAQLAAGCATDLEGRAADGWAAELEATPADLVKTKGGAR